MKPMTGRILVDSGVSGGTPAVSIADIARYAGKTFVLLACGATPWVAIIWAFGLI
jgi:hypothetical protein